MKTRLLATLLIFTQALGGFSPSALHANNPVPQRGGELSKEQRETINGIVRDSSAKIFFEKNAGQFAKDVRYGFKTKFGAMLVYDDHLRIASNQVNPATNEVGQHIVDMSFPGSDSHWQIAPGGSSGVTGSYQKADGGALKPDLFTEITLRDVYTGVDLRLYSAGKGVLEFDWIVARAQDYEKIRIAATGQDGVTFHEDGSAELALRFQSLAMKMPEVYQVIGGEKHAVAAAMVAGERAGEIRYALAGEIVRDQPLVIDPNIAWSTYFDLNDSTTPFDSYVFAINVNNTGVYVSGWIGETVTNATFGPGSAGNYMEVNAGFSQGTVANQAYVYRLNTAGTRITAWTSTGITASTGGVSNQAIAEEPSDLELFPDGRVLLPWSSGRIQIYSADLASRSYSAEPINVDMLNSVAILDNNTFYASGRVNAALAGVASIGPDTTFAGATEGFIIRYTLVAGVPTPDWGTYIGGDSAEYFTAIALTPDHTKLVFTTNTLLGANYPALVNAVDSTPGAAATTELLVGVLNEQATVPAAFDVFSFLGGSGNEGLVASNTTASLIVATNTHFYVAGNTASVDFPATTGGAQTSNAGGAFDVFATRIALNGSLGTGFQSTYIGGNAEDNVGGITYDTRANRILVYGTTAGGTFPLLNTTPGSGYYDSTLGGALDIFLTTYSADLTVKEYASIIGGPNNDYLGQTGDLIGQGHMGYSNVTGLCYLATTVHSDLPQLATPENALAGPGKDKTKSNGTNDTHYIVAFNSNTLDFGDAPVSYENGDPARDAASFNFHLGLTVDAEGSPFSSALADGDDLSNGGSANDEDGIAALAALTLEQTSYTNSVSVFNNTGSTQTLRAWIDFNQNGLFEASEFTSVSVPTNVAQQTVSLTWAAIPIAATKPGLNFMRLRLSDAALVDNVGTAAVDERSIGVGNAGEIEDYAITVTGASLAGTVYSDDDNSGTINGAELGINNVTLTLTGVDNLGNNVNVTTTTNASGNYSFIGLRPSNGSGYTITETQPSGFADGKNTVGTVGGVTTNVPATDIISGIPLGLNIAGTGYNFGELPGSTVTGHLYIDTNGNGVQNAGEPDLANVDVVITDSLGATQTVATNTSGNWTVIVPPGTTSANVSEADPQFPAGAVQIEGTDPTTVTAIANSTVSAGNDGYFIPATVTGHLYIDTNGNGAQNAAEPDLANVDVVITNSLGVNQTVVTNASGNWTASVPPGSTTANVSEADPQFPVGAVQTEGTDPTTVTAVANVSTNGGTDGYFIPATVTGHLYIDTNGNGTQNVGESDLANVDVVITNSLGVNQTVVTNASGNWTASVPPGSTSANVSEADPQFPVGAVQTEGTDPTTVTAVTGVSTNGGTDGYLIPATVTGHLYIDTNGNGVQNAGEPNLANVDVVITNSLGATQTVVTNASGNWTATVPPGSTTANVSEADPQFPVGAVQTEGTDPTTVTAVANVSTNGGTDGYFVPATVTGHLYVDTNGNGTQNAGEPNIANVNIVVTNSLGVNQTVVTNASGNWTATVPPGSTTANVDETDADFIAVVPAGFVETEGTDPTTVTAVSGVSTSAGNDGYFNPAPINGHLYVDTNGNGTQDAGEPNIANVNVVITNSLGVNQTVVTNASGNWAATVPPGSTTANVDETDPDFIAVVPAGFVETQGNDPTVFTAVANVNTSGGIDGYFNPATVTGHLYIDTNGNGAQNAGEPNLANVDVVITNSLGATQTVVTNASGNWTASVPPGSTTANVSEADPQFPVGAVQTEGTDPTTVTAVANVSTNGGTDGYFIPAIVTGHLYVDTNGNGVQNAGEPNLSNVDVIVTTSLGTTVIASTDANGDWSASVPPGVASANVDETDLAFSNNVPAGYVETEGTDPTTVTAVAGVSTSAGNDGYFIPATVTGHLYVDTNGNGVQDVGEPDLANVDVVITNSNGVNQTVVTNASGTWTATVPPGSTSANVSEADPQFPAGGVQTEGNDPTVFTAVANASVSGGIDGYFVPAPINGHLYVDTNGNGTQDVGEPNLANVDVLITDSLGATKTVSTNASGNWTTTVPPGTTSANVNEADPDFSSVVPAGFVETQGNDPTTFTAVANVNTSGGIDGYFIPATITGHLYIDTNGNGVQNAGEPDLAGVNVVITDSLGATQTLSTNASGNWTTTVPPGSTSANVDETDPQFPAGSSHTEGTDPTVFTAVANVSTNGGIDGYFIPAILTGHLYVDTNSNGTQDVGEPNLANVDVFITNSLGATQTVTTNASGIWTASVPPGSTTANVDETDPQFPAGGVQREGTDPTITTAVAGTTTNGGTDGYFIPAPINGHLYVDTNGNGVQDGAEPNLANVDVVITDSLGATQTVTTNASGNWTTTVPPGSTSANVTETDPDFTAVAPAGYIQTQGDDPTTFTAVANVNTSGGIDGYYIPATITGHLYIDTNGNGTQDIGEPNLPNIDIVVTDVNGTPRTVTTNITGDWTASVPPGNTSADVDETDPDFVIQVPAGYTQTEGNDPTPFVAVANATTSGGIDGYKLPASALHRISGVVFLDGPANNNIFDAADVRVPNVTVKLYRDINGDGIAQLTEFVASTVTIGDGTYAFPVQPNGPYLVAETNPGGTSDADADGPANTNDLIVVPLAGADVPARNFLDDGYVLHSISGAVTDGTNPIPGTIITLKNAAGDILAVIPTLLDGSYVFPNLPDGVYTVNETNPVGVTGGSDVDGGNPDLITVTLAGVNIPGRSFVDLIPAPSLHALSGTVYKDGPANNNTFDALDLPVANATITLYRDINGDGIPQASEFVGTTVTLIGGGYSFGHLGNGAYLIAETNPTAAISDADADGMPNTNDLIAAFVLGADVPVQDFLDDGFSLAAISGFVSDGTAKIPGVTLTLRNAAGDILGTTLTDNLGNYRFTGLPNGTYTVTETNPPGTIGGSDYDAGNPDVSNVTITGVDVPNVNFYDLIPANIPARVIYGYCKTPLMVNALRNLPPTGGTWRIVSVGRAQHGSVQIRPNGFVLYRSSINFNGKITDSFVVTLTDGTSTIQKTITVKDFASIAGTFQGMLAPTAGGFAGRATITLVNKATFTTQIAISGETLRVAGTLTGSLHYEKNLRLKNGGHTLLKLDYDDLSDTWGVALTGDVTLAAASPVARALKTATAFVGRTTSAFIPAAQPPAGFGAFSVTKTGATKVIGHIAGGGAYVMSASLLANGQASYYLSTNAFSLAGILGYTGPQAAPVGSLRWQYTAIGGAHADVALDVAGTHYTKPVGTASILGSVVPSLKFELLDTAVTTVVPVQSPAQPTIFTGFVGAKQFKLTFDSTTGIAIGAYKETAKSFNLHGVVLQSAAKAVGITDSLTDPTASWKLIAN